MKAETTPKAVAVAGRAVLTQLADAQQEAYDDGSRRPLALEHRGGYLLDPANALQAWRDSDLGVRARSHMVASARARPVGHLGTRARTEPIKVVLASRANWNFMRWVSEGFRKDARFEVRTLDFSTMHRLAKPTLASLNSLAFDHGDPEWRWLISDAGFAGLDHPDRYQIGLLQRADVVFADWCSYPAVWLSHFLPPGKPLIIRLHSFEAFTFWPHLVNWGRVDSLVFVADHVRRFFEAGLDVSEFGTRVATIPNVTDLRRYRLKKDRAAPRTLGLIGYASANKNPLMALDILRRLRADDSAWRLLLVGSTWRPNGDAGDDRHRLRLDAELRSADLAGAVEVIGHTDQVEHVLRRIGFVLSTSEREGTHESVIQAMASGAIPAIRRWPIARPWVREGKWPFDDRWMFDTPDEAAALILDAAGKEQFVSHSRAAQEEAVEKWSAPVVMSRLLELALAAANRGS